MSLQGFLYIVYLATICITYEWVGVCFPPPRAHTHTSTHCALLCHVTEYKSHYT